ncbi:hypothetical protein QQX98_007455 [Neonectria punicea]|uniref:Uncharacterized protein n=1 Tax=Neonectria punicea TaxID=979145 RepID=A0ABR1GYB4_9HYPO
MDPSDSNASQQPSNHSRVDVPNENEANYDESDNVNPPDSAPASLTASEESEGRRQTRRLKNRFKLPRRGDGRSSDRGVNRPHSRVPPAPQYHPGAHIPSDYGGYTDPTSPYYVPPYYPNGYFGTGYQLPPHLQQYTFTPPPPPQSEPPLKVQDAASETVTVEVVSLGLENAQNPGFSDDPLTRAWLEPTTNPESGQKTTTKLVVAQASEHFIDGDGQSKITLAALPEALRSMDKGTSKIQLRWL